MKFQGITGGFTEANVEALAVAVFKGEKAASAELKDLDKLTGGLVAEVMKSEGFKGDAGQTALLRFAAKRDGKSDPSVARRRRRQGRICRPFGCRICRYRNALPAQTQC